MSHSPVTCLRCETPLETGCLVTPVYSGVGLLVHAHNVEWHATPPNHKLLGFTLAEERLPLVARRCPECGHVELFATED